FQARAALVQPQFTVSPGNVASVASVCRRLDGIPLAIELAAARTEMMSVDDILGRLEDRFRLLTGGSRTAMPRHQTLRAALDWGHHLLNAPERKLFRRLAVFPGSFELAAAEAVCAGPDMPAAEVLDLLSRLVDKSLVVPRAGPGGQTRYLMLETIRQYAAERLLEAGEEDPLRSRHLEHFLALAEHAATFERRPGQADWLERLEAGQEELAGWTLSVLGSAYTYLGDDDRGLASLEEMLALARDSEQRVDALVSLGELLLLRGDLAGARSRLEEGLAAGTGPDSRWIL